MNIHLFVQVVHNTVLIDAIRFGSPAMKQFCVELELPAMKQFCVDSLIMM